MSEFEEQMRGADPAADVAGFSPKAQAEILRKAKGKRFPVLRWGSAAAALLLVGVLSVGQVIGGLQHAAAVETLGNAANRTAPVPTPAAGQYQLVKLRQKTVYESGDGAHWAVLVEHREYLPTDPDQPILLINGKAQAIEQLDGPKGEFGPGKQYVTLKRPDNEHEGYWAWPSADWLSALPTNAEDFKRLLYQDAEGRTVNDDDEAFVLLLDLLRSGRTTAEQRSLVYQVAAEIPGTRQVPGTVELDGRTGVAIQHQNWLSSTDAIVLDPESGEFLGILSQQSGWMPGGSKVRNWTVVSTEVVDELPAEELAQACVEQAGGETVC